MSEIKVNKITPRVACGTTQLGDSGDTFTIPSGATITNAGTASGFGATGETSWDTTVKTTGTFTATAGVGYFLNTTGGIITVNLAAGTAGDSVALADYAGTFQTNNVTVAANGTEKIGGVDADVTLSTEGQSVTFVYIDGTQGWVNVLDSTSNVRGSAFMAASVSGACNAITTSGNCKIATFKGPGTFTVCRVAVCAANNEVSYMVAAGGGGGTCAGAGAGGFRETKSPVTSYTASPLDGYGTPGNRITVTATGYPIVVGGGGTAGTGGPSTPYTCGAKGATSTFSTICSAGGGRGAGGAPPQPEQNGGSGGGGRGGSGGTSSPNYGNASSGNTPPVTPSQGNNGGEGSGPSAGGGPPAMRGGGGGGAGAIGSPGPGGCSGNGGIGIGTAINPVVGDSGPSPSLKYFAGGGGAAQWSPPGYQPASTGGFGGGGDAPNSPPFSPPLVNGGCNTGGGGASVRSVDNAPGGSGGSGIVIIRYKFQ